MHEIEIEKIVNRWCLKTEQPHAKEIGALSHTTFNSKCIKKLVFTFETIKKEAKQSQNTAWYYLQ